MNSFSFDFYRFPLLQRQSHLILTQARVMLCVCEASASDVSVIVSAYDGVRPQPRGVPTGESSRPSQGDWVLPHRANGSPPAGREATEDPCHPLPLFALSALCQASGGKAHTNTHECTHTLNWGRGRNYPIIECHHI